MRKNHILLVFAIFIATILSSCEDLEKFKQVKKIAVTGVLYDLRIADVVEGQPEDDAPINILSFDPAKGIQMGEKLTAADRDSFHEFLNNLFDNIEDSTSVQLSSNQAIANDPAFIELPEMKNSLQDYVPKSFRYVNIGDPVVAKSLCDKLGVDAVANLKFQFKRVQKLGQIDKQESGVMFGSEEDIYGTLKMRMTVEIQIVDKNGVTALSRKIDGDSMPIINMPEATTVFQGEAEAGNTAVTTEIQVSVPFFENQKLPVELYSQSSNALIETLINSINNARK